MSNDGKRLGESLDRIFLGQLSDYNTIRDEMEIKESASSATKVTGDVTHTLKRIAETTVRKTWSILDAASQKEAPEQYLSKQAIRAIQGENALDLQ